MSLSLSLGGYEFEKEQGGYMWEGVEGGKGREKIIIIQSQNNSVFKKMKTTTITQTTYQGSLDG